MARTLSTHKQPRRLVLLKEIKVNPALFAAAPSKTIAEQNEERLYGISRRNGVTVCMSTICWLPYCLQGANCIPFPTKLQLCMTRGTISALGSAVWTNSQAEGSRDHQISQKFAQSHPGSRRGTWCLSTRGHHPDAL